ncbi:hypothetical protein NMG60_11009649 [Bertholletia excelsa]
MEEYPSIQMERTGKIFRRSIHTFLQNYQYFTLTSSLLAFPFSASLFVAQALIPFSPLLPTIQNHLASLFDAAGFPQSQFFTIFNLKLSQTITCFILVLPLTISFLLLAKSSIIQALSPPKSSEKPFSFSSFLSIYNSILITHVYNSLVILSANSTCFSFLFLLFNFLEGLKYSCPVSLLFFSVSGAALYSVFIANALITCNLALVLTGMERHGGFLQILKACVLIRGRTATALVLALPTNLALASVEALFQYRVVGACYQTFSMSVALEGILIAYLYSIVLVIDTIISCLFFKSCKTACGVDRERRRGSCRTSIEGQEDCSNLGASTTSEDLQ